MIEDKMQNSDKWRKLLRNLSRNSEWVRKGWQVCQNLTKSFSMAILLDLVRAADPSIVLQLKEKIVQIVVIDLSNNHDP